MLLNNLFGTREDQSNPIISHIYFIYLQMYRWFIKGISKVHGEVVAKIHLTASNG